MFLVDLLLILSALLLALVTAFLSIEIIAGLLANFRRSVIQNPRSRERPRICVLVPAHNEGSGLVPTLADIRAQLAPRDRLIVIADNCTDDTVAMAYGTGAEVIERQDLTRLGKGYALAHGLRHLSGAPPDVVIFIDADCRVSAGAIAELAKISVATCRPVQALDLMIAPDGGRINHKVAEFAWRVRNFIRPLGLRALRLPCQLMGTGMSFPWEIIAAADVAADSLVEDLMLGLELTRVGHPPIFCPSVSVTSYFPGSVTGSKTQRFRWEKGHITSIIAMVPRLLLNNVTTPNLGLLVLTLDLAIPPLTLLGFLITSILVASGIASLMGFPSCAFIISAWTLSAYLICLILSWFAIGREVVPLNAAWSLVPFMFEKILLYLEIALGRTRSHWIRTERGTPQRDITDHSA